MQHIFQNSYEETPMWEYLQSLGLLDIDPMLIVSIIMASLLVSLIIFILMFRFIRKEALRRKIPIVEFWILIFLIFGIIGLIVYLIVRDIYPPKENR